MASASMSKEQADYEMARLVYGYAAGVITDEEYQERGRWLGPIWTRLWQEEIGYPIPCEVPRSAA